jgi:hypothetical protein
MTIVRVNSGKVWVRFQVLTAKSMKMAVFWDVATCSLELDDGSGKLL